MMGVIIVCSLCVLIGICIGLALAVPVINRLEARVKKLDMACGYRGIE